MDGRHDRGTRRRAVRRSPNRHPHHGLWQIRRHTHMPAMTELKGKELGTTKVRIERGPVQAFARAITDDPEHYATDDAVVPPTFPFVWGYWGTVEGRTGGLPIEDLRGPGRMILHGEQEFD